MAVDKAQQVKELLNEAVDRPQAERAAFLDEACGSDLDLRQQVERLLKALAQNPDFLEEPPSTGFGLEECTTSDTTLVGEHISHFELTGVIATGGMGTVYEAVQDNPRRAVAVKVMRQGLSSKSAMRRFEYEAQVLARLQHPGIAQVFEAGTYDQNGGVPYFVMEHVPNARPITDYAKENKLSTRQRLELFTAVCDAVHHGHQKGIIHRDLKPANILIDANGAPKVIDHTRAVVDVTAHAICVNPRS